ncbi:beta-galactosidase [Terribacillus sp. DMT04]|uniref:beta-galactosidase n=1 Tax=Terribacillus sp. DMT04 TaxID=2850441 RepID=UPI001C2C7837|nr:beta-galactosidase [Terribacillus sp. DMT04]QXE01415.1 beta-galactosidase [Terribacillus sp. DMT04]
MTNNKRNINVPFLLHGGDYNPDQWLKYPDVLKEDIQFMQAANTNTFSIGIFAWSALEPEEGVYTFEWLDKIFDDIHAFGGKVILATPSGARPAWLSQKYPDVLRVNAARVKQLHGGRHNHCFTSPAYLEKTQNMNRKLAERYGEHPALLLWHISNEYSGDCHCDRCQTAFREWLKERYDGGLDALNDAWWGPFWSHAFTNWEQVESPSPNGEDGVHGLRLDWRRFVTDQTIRFMENEMVPIRELTPDIPVTTNFMADTPDLIPFRGLDYQRFADKIDVISWDAYPTWHNDWETTAELAMKVGFIDDLYRTMKDQPFLLMENTPSMVNWHPVNKAKRPGMHILSSMQMIAHGSDSILYFQWRKSRGSTEKFHGAVVDHDRSPDNRVFREVAALGANMEKLACLAGAHRTAEVALLYDWENDWALEDAQGYGLDSKQYIKTMHAHYRPFWKRDIPVDVIGKTHNFQKYKLLVVPMLYMMENKTAEKLEKFVQAGGRLVMTYISGVADEHDLVHPGAWQEKLADIFGLRPAETDTLYPADRNSVEYKGKAYELKDYATVLKLHGAKAIGSYEKDFYAGTPAITEHAYGEGSAYYIGARLEDAFQEDFYEELLLKEHIVAPVRIKKEADVSVQVRFHAHTTFVFIMNFSESEKAIEMDQTYQDILQGGSLEGHYLLKPYEVKVLQF